MMRLAKQIIQEGQGQVGACRIHLRGRSSPVAAHFEEFADDPVVARRIAFLDQKPPPFVKLAWVQLVLASDIPNARPVREGLEADHPLLPGASPPMALNLTQYRRLMHLPDLELVTSFVTSQATHSAKQQQKRSSDASAFPNDELSIPGCRLAFPDDNVAILGRRYPILRQTP